MKKKLIGILIVIGAIVLASTVSFASGNTFQLASYSIKLGNSVVELNSPIYASDGKTYVSLRDICDELRIPIYWDSEKSEVVVDIFNKTVQVSDKTEFKEAGIVPDEETALAIGKIVLETYAGRPMEYETDEKIFYLRATYIEKQNAWNVVQFFDYKEDGKGWAMGGMGGIDMCRVVISRLTGEVLSISTYSYFER
jgi:Copper amine oxidase N-terminal domain.